MTLEVVMMNVIWVFAVKTPTKQVLNMVKSGIISSLMSV